MAELMKLFERGFTRQQPEVRFEEDLNSTLTAVPGVYQGRADIGLLGREIWESEVDGFKSAKGHGPLIVNVATGSYDVPKATFALMVFVPKTNPLHSISMTQLERIFASTDNQVRTWGELGLRGEWSKRPIHIYGFEVMNDKAHIFRTLVFAQSQHWNPAMKEFANEPGDGGKDAGERIVDAVESDPDAIGISNVHYATPGVKSLAITAPHNGRAVTPSRANVTNRTYPLSRSVYMVVDPEAVDRPGAAVLEFLKYVLSRQGQQDVAREGNYLPLTPKLASVELERIPAR
jgi:phosphate transport system substrate-binding protein